MLNSIVEHFYNRLKVKDVFVLQGIQHYYCNKFII